MTRLQFPARPSRKKTEFGTRRTWRADPYQITKTGDGPYVIWQWWMVFDEHESRRVSGFRPIHQFEHSSLAAAIRTCKALAAGRTVAQLLTENETKKQRAKARRALKAAQAGKEAAL
jgi:hypothetical protein